MVQRAYSDRRGMQAAHGDDHPADAAGDGAASEQAAMMQCLNRHAFADAKLAKPLPFDIGKRRPMNAVDGRWLAKR